MDGHTVLYVESNLTEQGATKNYVCLFSLYERVLPCKLRQYKCIPDKEQEIVKVVFGE